VIRRFLARFFGPRCDWALWTADPCWRRGRFLSLMPNSTLGRHTLYCEKHVLQGQDEDRKS
jgi:hypothetical protein